jgi:hypothetical protein
MGKILRRITYCEMRTIHSISLRPSSVRVWPYWLNPVREFWISPNCSHSWNFRLVSTQQISLSDQLCKNTFCVVPFSISHIITLISHFHARSPNCEKRLLVSPCLYVRLSVRMEHLSTQWTDFHEIWYLSLFRKYVKKIIVHLKLDKNKWHFTWRPIYIFDHISLIYS